jgi:hypothetical protein
MKAIWNKWVLFAAIMTGVSGAMAQDNSASYTRELKTSPANRISWDQYMEPQIMLGDTRVTGLIVDCMTPQYVSIMLDKTIVVPPETPPAMLPVKVPHTIHDPAAHEPDFALIRFGF